MANLFALSVLLCWIPISVAIFWCLPIARALSVSYVVGWLFLPFVTYQFPLIPDFDKATAVLLGSSLGLLLHKDASRVLHEFRMSWIDVPALVLCVGALVTSLINDLGIWDGVAGALQMLCVWAGPYFLGRLVFRSTNDILELAKAIFVGGLLYVPLCLFESRMYPTLNYMVYGFWPRGAGSVRLGGWRPCVFLDCGLELGMWMTASCLVGFVLWHLGRMRKIASLPVGVLLLGLLFTTVLCRSTGALVLLVAGVACSWSGSLVRSTIPILLLLTIPFVYIALRTTGLSDGRFMVALSRNIDDDRAASLEFRLINEDLLIARALERRWFGWGGWGRSRVYDEYGNDISITDGRWIIVLGQLGMIGLIATYGTLLIPCFAAVVRGGGRLFHDAEAAPVVALTLVAALFALDSLLNSFPNPIYLLGAGAVGSFAQFGLGPRFEVPAGPATTAPGPTLTRNSWPPPDRKTPAETGG